MPVTLGGVGDPIDVLLLMDEQAFTGCLGVARLLGVMEAEQTESGATMRNDLVIGVAHKSRTHGDFRSLDDVNKRRLGADRTLLHLLQRGKPKTFRILDASARHAPRRSPPRRDHALAASAISVGHVRPAFADESR